MDLIQNPTEFSSVIEKLILKWTLNSTKSTITKSNFQKENKLGGFILPDFKTFQLRYRSDQDSKIWHKGEQIGKINKIQGWSKDCMWWIFFKGIMLKNTLPLISLTIFPHFKHTRCTGSATFWSSSWHPLSWGPNSEPAAAQGRSKTGSCSHHGESRAPN